MSYKITCPYCFREFADDDVSFRSEKVNRGENSILPDDYDDIDDFRARYRGGDKDDILSRYNDWEFFAEIEDAEYEVFWKDFSGTTENNPADEVLRIKAYHRRIIDPRNPQHQRYLRRQSNGTYFIYDEQEMVSQVELEGGVRCNRRVCPHCHNPLPDDYGKNPVKFVTVIGISGAGKTVYLSQLLRKMRTYAAKVGLNAIVDNPSVVTFLERNAVADKQELPGSTPVAQFQQPLFYKMVCNTGGNGRVTETFVLYDVAGEVFRASALVHKFAPFIEHAAGVLMLIDPMQFEVVSGAAVNGKALDDPATVLDVIHNIVSHGRDDIKCGIPFAICVSKIDTCEVQSVLSDELKRMLMDDVRAERVNGGFNKPVFNARDYNPVAKELNEFILANEIALAQQMQTNYSSYAYFAFTALGCATLEGTRESGEKYQYPVGPILPKRVEEPILWLFHKLNYIGANDRIMSFKGNPLCEICGSDDTCELEDGELVMVTGWGPFKKKQNVKYACNGCGYRW